MFPVSPLTFVLQMRKFGGVSPLGEAGRGRPGPRNNFYLYFFLNFEFAKGSSLAASCGDWGVRFARAFGAKVMCPWDGERFSDFFPALGIFIFFPFSS